MRPNDPTSRHGGGCVHPTALLALSIGMGIGACWSSPPALGAERNAIGAGIAVESGGVGPPKRMTPAPVAAQPGGSADGAVGRYDGDAPYRQCIDRSDGTNVAWDRCGVALIAREDAKLNIAWSRVYAPGAPAHGPDLLNEQRAWNAFKESSCRFYASGGFGREGQVLSFPVCRAGVIAARTAALLAYVADTAPQ